MKKVDLKRRVDETFPEAGVILLFSREGDRVNYQIQQGQKGSEAKNIKLPMVSTIFSG